MHHYNSTQYCNTETVFIYIPLPPDITSQMWPSGGKGGLRARETDISAGLKRLWTKWIVSNSTLSPVCTSSYYLSDWQPEALCFLRVRPLVRSSLTKLVNKVLQK